MVSKSTTRKSQDRHASSKQERGTPHEQNGSMKDGRRDSTQPHPRDRHPPVAYAPLQSATHSPLSLAHPYQTLNLSLYAERFAVLSKMRVTRSNTCFDVCHLLDILRRPWDHTRILTS